MVVRLCVAVLVVFMGTIFLRFFTLNVLIEKLTMDNTFTRMVFFDKPNLEMELDNLAVQVVIDWRSIYPFAGRDTTRSATMADRLARLQQRIFDIETKIEGYTKESLVNRIMFAEWAIQYERVAGWNFLNGDVADIGDGYLSEVQAKHSAAANAGALAELYGFLQGLRINFLYVQAPYKIAPDDAISGVRDFSNRNADDLLHTLSQRGVPYLDLRENIREEGLDHHDLFYKTDHHWKAETGVWASGILVNYLNKNHGFNFNPLLVNPVEYNYTLYKDWFLGSYGKKVTLTYAAAEDFVLLTPKFDTDFSLAIPELNLDVRGNYDILIDRSQIDIKDYYGSSPYEAYMYSNRQLITVHNNLIQGGKKLLLLKDSFAEVVSPFLSAGIEELHILDLRNFNGSLKSYIEKNRPDIVIVLYNPSVLDNEHKPLFDFR
jgi:hypothetical protein